MFTTSLNNLCKPFPILLYDSYDPLRSLCICLIRSHIFNLAYLALISGHIWFLSRIYSRGFVLIDPSSESFSVDDSSIEAKIDSYYTSFRSFSTKFPSSNCAKVIIFPVCSWDYLACGIYNTAACIASASEYVRYVYANALEKRLSNKTSCEEKKFCVIVT